MTDIKVLMKRYAETRKEIQALMLGMDDKAMAPLLFELTNDAVDILRGGARASRQDQVMAQAFVDMAMSVIYEVHPKIAEVIVSVVMAQDPVQALDDMGATRLDSNEEPAN